MAKRKYDQDAILKDWQAGMLGKDLEAKYGCTRNYASKLAKLRGLTRSPEVVKRVSITAGKLGQMARAKSPQRLKDAAKRERIAEHAKQHGISSTAKKYGYSVEAVRIMAKAHGWKPDPQFDRKAILSDYLGGMPLADVAAKYGCNLSYPSSLARLAGVKRDRSLWKKWVNSG